MKNFHSQRNLFALLCWFLAIPLGWSQIQTPLDIALRHIEQNHKAWGLTDRDVADMGVNYQYTSNHNGVSHIYFIQRHGGLEVYNAIMNINTLPDGKVLSVGKRFHPDLASRVNATQPALTPWDAIQQAAAQLGYSGWSDVRLMEKTGDYAYSYSGGTLSRSDIKIALRYQAVSDGKVRLAWDLAIENFGNSDYWSVRVDALTGSILNKINWTVSCKLDGDLYHNHDRQCREEENEYVSVREAVEKNSFFLSDGSAYRVFPLPVESPNFGPRQLLTDPADPTASPFGWHDTDAAAGPEYTFTRGNNVHAYPDLDGNSMSDFNVSGGATLLFDFPYNADWEPDQMIPASVTNLFYMNNMMHDITYHYGFDEEAGNFQANNYGNEGQGDDYVNARGQFSGDAPVGDLLNNADFSTPPDGQNGTMRMFYWSLGSSLLEVTSPSIIAGLYSTGEAEFGPSVAEQPVSGPVVEVNDGVANEQLTDGCEDPYVNASELAGKIALIDRGGCFFELKVLYAEQNGAIGAIICNFEDAVFGMGGTPAVDNPSIPSISVSSSTCAIIRQYAGTSLVVTLAVPTNGGPEFLSGDFDNGVIAHEYGHGISTRLTGGPAQSGCLGGDEQMGEGWSDFFTLITSVEAGDVGSDIRGIGTYVMRQFTEGKGFRTYPYSTDMNINPFTYKNIVSETVPHGVGAVWSTMLWDLYWAFVDAYGWDPNLIGGTGGNNMAIQLVMDGMKMQPCDPGFVDGRDAILDADQALFGGANQCLIWEVFARRGLGYFADQGSSFSRGDGKENFDPLPTCIPELKISKTATDFIQPGDDINYTIKVVNHKPEAVTNVVVTDELPAGVSYKAGSGSIAPTVNGNLLSFELGTMVFGDDITITFKGESDPGQYSIQHYLEEFEESTFGIWVDYPAGTVEANNEWVVQSQVSFSPTKAFFVPSLGTESQQILQLVQAQPVQGDVPVLRFYHRYQTQPGADGGYVQVSVDEGNNWVGVANKFLQNGYPGPITYTTFVVPNLSAFTGNSNGFIPSYVDLSEYAGEDIQVRFKFGTDESIAEGAGWYVDDVEMMDLLSYNSEACVSSDEGDQACASAPSLGTIVDSQLPDAVEEVSLDGLSFSVFPNPARDILNIRFTADHPTDISLKVITLDGKEMLALSGSLIGTEILPVDVSQLPKGMYVVQVITALGSALEKVVID